MTEEEIFLTSILNCSRAHLYTQDISLDAQKYKRLLQCLSLRSQGFPLQYILGEVEFFGLVFKVDKRVFIPRPETEILVETAINKAKNKKKELKVLELGTGSGCIAISLAKFLPSAQVTAADISSDALDVARENARLNKVDGKIEFILSDLFAGTSLSLCYDILIFNPPYICSQDIGHLQRELGFEPRIALDGGSDGLDFYRRIIREAPRFLKKDGLLLLEIGFGQRDGIARLVRRQAQLLKLQEVIKDYSGIERIIIVENG